MSYLLLRRHYSTGADTAKKFTQQHHLGTALRQLFPNQNLRENVRKEGSIQFPSTLNFLEIDFWIPDLRLAFEFQDNYHYNKESIVQKSLDYVNTRDDFKKAMLVDRGETLVRIPYWWDGTLESLTATIRLQREDLLLNCPITSPIPNQPPFTTHQKGSIPDVGELMLVAVPDAPLLEPEKWWVSEKYDGIRGCWNPRTNTVYARSGGEIVVPQLIIRHLPSDAFIDFEFWFGKGSFDESAKALWLTARQKPKEVFELTHDDRNDIAEKAREITEWNFLRILVVDCPAPALAPLPFEERVTSLMDSIYSSHPFLMFILQIASKGRKFLENTMEVVLQDGGEGIVMRKINSTYSGGRGDSLYKLKTMRDEEVLLVSIENSEQTFRVQFPEGYLVDSPVPSSMVASEVKPGDVLTVRVHMYKDNAPNHVVVMRARRDLTWPDVLANYQQQAHYTTEPSGVENLRALKEPHKRKPAGHWTADDSINVRKQLDHFAQRRGLDPLNPDTWYSISTLELQKECGTTFMHNFNRSFTRSLAAVYPNIGLKMARFKRKPGSFWTTLVNQRAYLDDFAAQNGFDPLIPENWKDFTVSKLKEHNGYTLLTKYNSSPFQTLRGVYPELTFKATDFPTVPRKYWTSVENRKKAFDEYAASRGFDPLVAENWFSVIAESKSEVISPLAHFYMGSFQSALTDVYPKLEFTPLKFDRLKRNYWKTPGNLRNFMTDVASKNNFDPFAPEVWLSKGYKCIVKEKHGNSVISIFGSVARIIQLAFPEMGIESIATKVKLSKDRGKIVDRTTL